MVKEDTKICKCGKTFTTTKKTKFYCSTECYRKLKNIKLRICEQCGVTFHQHTYVTKIQNQRRNRNVCNICTANLKIVGEFKKSKFNAPYNILEDNEFISYLIGFGFADGTVSANRIISYYNTEKDIIEKIIGKLNNSANPAVDSTNNKRNPKYKLMYQTSMSKRDSIKLIDLGFIRSKEDRSLNTLLENGIDLYKFLLGFLNGDGTLFLNKKSKLQNLRFLARHKLALEIQDKFKELGICSSVLKPTTNLKEGGLVKTSNDRIYTVNVSLKDAKDLLDKMYLNSTIHMNKKYNLYKSIVWPTRGIVRE